MSFTLSRKDGQITGAQVSIDLRPTPGVVFAGPVELKEMDTKRWVVLGPEGKQPGLAEALAYRFDGDVLILTISPEDGVKGEYKFKKASTGK